ncbi:MAG: tetratricopeptide repeat protein [Chitinophagaceae bacterium]|nr:tetratricopeptide repeat protein [Chitinophagaceae bacterium]
MKNVFTLCLLFSTTALFAQTTDSSSYYFKKGIEEKDAKRYQVASKYFGEAIQLNPTYTVAYVENGYANLEMRKIDEAKQNFTRAYELDPGNDAAIKELVELNYNYHHYQKAIDLAQKCKNCPNADRIVAMSYYQLEDYPKAEKNLLPLLEKNPTDAELTYITGRNYMEMGMELKAIPYYVKAIQLDESRSNWMFEVGLLYYNNNDFKNAVVYFNKAVEKGFIQSNDFNENLGFAYLYSGEYEKGEKLLLEIYERRPGDKDILLDMAQAYYDSRMYDKSLNICQKLLEADKNDGKALYQAGMCFQRKGQTQRGQQMCDRAIELDPSLNKLRQKKMTAGL